MLEENQAILKTGLDVIKKEGDTIYIERVVLNLNIYLMVTLVGEDCSWRWTILEMKLHSTANVKIIFSSKLTGGRGAGSEASTVLVLREAACEVICH